jgi:hypothetical protein
VLFYSNRTALLLNGRVNNLEYGSYAPGSPAVFIDDTAFMRLWSGTIRYYLVTDSSGFARLSALAGPAHFHQVAASGGKFLFTNGLSSEPADGSNMENKPALW